MWKRKIVYGSSDYERGTGQKPLPVVMTENPIIPSYGVKRADGGVSLEFRCPVCGSTHSHGLPADGYASPMQWRGSHCLADNFAGKNYRLLLVGWRRGTLPVCSAAEIDALNNVILETKR